MAKVTVRVTPRSGRTQVRADEDGVRVWVGSAPSDGKATEEARRALADALGVARSTVRLRTGARSRVKVFEVDDLSDAEVAMRLRAT